VYIFDGRLAVTINGKDVTETVTPAELKGSDLDCFVSPKDAFQGVVDSS
jgi:hypothetical protein